MKDQPVTPNGIGNTRFANIAFVRRIDEDEPWLPVSADLVPSEIKDPDTIGDLLADPTLCAMSVTDGFDYRAINVDELEKAEHGPSH